MKLATPIRSAITRRWRHARHLLRTEQLFVVSEWKQSRTHAITWRYRLRCWWNGFLTYRAPLYRLQDPVDGPLYVRDRELYGNSGMNLPFARLADSKVAFWALLRSITSHGEPTEGMVFRGRFFSMGADAGTSLINLLARLRGNYYLKPPGGSAGMGILYLECGDAGFRVNGKATTAAGLIGSLSDGAYLVVPELRQAAYARAVQPATSNTVRLLTVFDDATGLAHVVAAAHSFGHSGSGAPVDHWYRGGIACDVDLDSGVLGPGVLFPRDGVRRDVTAHPETGVRVAGLQIPQWREIRAEVERVAASLGFLPYLGWDVLVTDENFFLLEGNTRSSLGLLQLKTPLLANQHFRTMLRRHGLLPRRLK